MPHRRDVERAAQPAVRVVLRLLALLVQRHTKLCRRRHVGDHERGRESGVQIRIVKESRRNDRTRSRGVARQNHRGSFPNSCRWMLQRVHCRSICRRTRVLQFSQTFQRPKRMKCAAADSDRIHRLVANEVDHSWNDIFLATFHDQALRRQPPEHVVRVERIEQSRRVVPGQTSRFRWRRVLVCDAVDPAAEAIPE